MKRICALFLALVLLFPGALAEDLFTFAGIPLDTPFSDMKTALESATGLSFTVDGSMITSEYHPPITFMKVPVSLLAAANTKAGVCIELILDALDFTINEDSLYQITGEDNYIRLRAASDERFGKYTRGTAVFYKEDGSEITYRLDDPRELDSLILDASFVLITGKYVKARVSLYRKNIMEFYEFKNSTDSTAKIWSARITPGFLYYPVDTGILMTDQVYQALPVFPLLNGDMVTADF